jgi:hypothetical protein
MAKTTAMKKENEFQMKKAPLKIGIVKNCCTKEGEEL